VKKQENINNFYKNEDKKTKLSKFHMVFANCEAKLYNKL